MSEILTLSMHVQEALRNIVEAGELIQFEGWNDTTNYEDKWVETVIRPTIQALSIAHRSLTRASELIDDDVKEAAEQLHDDEIAMDYDQ